MKLDSSLCESASTTSKQKVKEASFIPAVFSFVGLLTCPEGGVVVS